MRERAAAVGRWRAGGTPGCGDCRCACVRASGLTPPAPPCRHAVQGVTAYLGRATQRERPNERFLQNMLRNVQQANRRAEEEEMWQVRQEQLQREQREASARRRRQRSPSLEARKRRHDSSSGGGGGADGQRDPRPAGCSSQRGDSDAEEAAERRQSAAAAAAEGEQDCGGKAGSDCEAALAAMLASKRPRGRGSTGARVDLAGPYLEGRKASEGVNEDVEVTVRRQQPVGPARPEWLHSPSAAAAAADMEGGSQSSDSSRERREERRRRKEEKKAKKKKKHKKEKKRGC